MPKFLVAFEVVSYPVGAKTVGYSMGRTVIDLEALPQTNEEIKALEQILGGNGGWSHVTIIAFTKLD